VKHLQVTEIGRCAKELNRYPILPGRDAEEILLQEVEFYWEHDAIITPIVGEPGYAVLRKPSLIGGRRNLRIRIVEVGVSDMDTVEIEIGANDFGTEEYSK